MGMRGDCRCRRSSTFRSGSLAGATIEVWKAWLTDNGDHVVAGFLKGFHGLLNGLAGAADDGLVLAVNVGDHDIAVDGLQNALDLRAGERTRRHASLVFRCKRGSSRGRGR